MRIYFAAVLCHQIRLQSSENIPITFTFRSVYATRRKMSSGINSASSIFNLPFHFQTIDTYQKESPSTALFTILPSVPCVISRLMQKNKTA